MKFAIILSFFLIPLASAAQTTRTVTQVVDGDTLVLDGGETVILLGAQAPEFPAPHESKDGKMKKPDSLAQSWAERAKAFTEGMVLGRQVWLEYDQVRKDNQGRTLAYVNFKLDKTQSLGGGGGKVLMTPGTYMLNRLVVQYGFGTSGSSYPFQYRAQFNELEAEAKQQQVGLWQSNF